MYPKQSIKVRLAQIRALDLTASYKPEYREYRIDYKRGDRRWSKDSAYFTDNADDALDTAHAMSGIPFGCRFNRS